MDQANVPQQFRGVRIPDVRWSGHSFLGLMKRNKIGFEIVDITEDNATIVAFKSTNDFERACTMWQCLTGVKRIGYIPYKQFVN